MADMDEAAHNSTNPFTNPFKIAHGDMEREPARDEEKGEDESTEPADLKRRESEIAAREAALVERERSILLREAAVASTKPQPNYPPCFPVIHHSLEDIPDANKPLARSAFIYLHVLELALVFNFVANTLAFSVTGFLVSLAYIPLVSYVAFYWQYASLLRAARQSAISDRRMVWFLLHFAAGQAFNAIMAVGILCGAGLLAALSASDGVDQAIMFTATTMWAVTLGFGVVLLRRAIAVWKAAGGTVDKAKAEVTTAAVVEGAVVGYGGSYGGGMGGTHQESWASRAGGRSTGCVVM